MRFNELPSCLSTPPSFEHGLTLLEFVQRAVVTGESKPCGYTVAGREILTAIGIPDAPRLEEAHYETTTTWLREWLETAHQNLRASHKGVKIPRNIRKAIEDVPQEATISVFKVTLVDAALHLPVAAVMTTVETDKQRISRVKHIDFAPLHAEHYVNLMLRSARFLGGGSDESQAALLREVETRLVTAVREKHVFRVTEILAPLAS